MSYILDALRRAEVERARERGKVPGLHDPSPAGAPLPTSDPRDTRRGAWIGGGVVVVLVAAALAWTSRDHGDAAPVVARAGPGVAPATTRAASTMAPSPATTSATTPPTPTMAAPGSPTPATSLSSATTVPHELMPVPALPRAEPAPRATTTAPPTSASTPAAPNASTAETSRLYESGELPEDIRRALPPLTFGGAMYSDNASARLLIVNGQVVHEGEPVAKGVVLEQIRLKTAVLSFRGYRFLVSY